MKQCFINIFSYRFLFIKIFEFGLIMVSGDLLKNKGLKSTAQRCAVIDILDKQLMPMTENEIKDKMGDLYDRITFYRTIQTLIKAEIIHRVILDNTTIKYALNTESKPSHVHFFCEKCHALSCMHQIPSHNYKLPEGYSQTHCEVIIKGVCDRCNKEENL